MVMKPFKLQRSTNKDHKIYVGRSTTVHNLLFCAHTLWLNYVTVTFLLVSSSGTNHHLLCFVHGQDKKANKNIEQRILPNFIAIYLINYGKMFIPLCNYLKSPASELQKQHHATITPPASVMF